MRVDVRANPIVEAEFLRAHVERRMRSALGRFHPRITGVTVEVEDDNGPRGGVDKSCRITAVLTGLDSVHVKAMAADIYDVVDRAAGRIERAVGRDLSKARARSSETIRGKIHEHT